MGNKEYKGLCKKEGLMNMPEKEDMLEFILSQNDDDERDNNDTNFGDVVERNTTPKNPIYILGVDLAKRTYNKD